MKQLKLYIAVTLMVMAVGLAYATDFKAESLNYKVLYKWGLVNKTAGRATLSLRPTSSVYHAKLTARTEPWADHVYHLRDTLTSTMNKQTLLPTRYEKIAREDGKYGKDIVEFTYSGNTVLGKCTRYRKGKKDSEVKTSKTSLSASGETFDMLSVFYYIRSIDFNGLGNGKSRVVNIFSGKKKETLTVTYKGLEQISVAGQKRNTYHVTFTFTNNGSKSSEPINAWLSADERVIPLKVEGQLKIGKVIVEYTGG